VGAVQEF